MGWVTDILARAGKFAPDSESKPAPTATDTGLETVKWPYQKTFNAIGAAVKIQGDAKAISVQAFIEAFGDELVTRSQAVELLAAKDAQIAGDTLEKLK